MSSSLSERDESLARRVNVLWSETRQRDMTTLARNTGATLQERRFLLQVWGRILEFNWDDCIAFDTQTRVECDVLTQAMLAYYFHTADGFPPDDHWIAFTQLPDGQFYSSAFQGYTGNKLAHHFGNDAGSFSKSALATGGQHLPLGDAAFRFQALPRVAVAAVCWLGDEDFPPSYRILFEQAVDHYLPTDACAILGSTLTSKLIAAGVTGAGPHKM